MGFCKDSSLVVYEEQSDIADPLGALSSRVAVSIEDLSIVRDARTLTHSGHGATPMDKEWTTFMRRLTQWFPDFNLFSILSSSVPVVIIVKTVFLLFGFVIPVCVICLLRVSRIEKLKSSC
ncbi:hypothetical protein Dimus_019155 [Dionaea muscipula]